MFGGKSNGPSMFVWIGIAALVVGAMGVRMWARSGERTGYGYVDSVEFKRALGEVERRDRNPLGASPYLNPAPGVSHADARGSVAKVCAKLASCGGTGVAAETACIEQQMRAATDDFSRGLVKKANDDIFACCGAKECDGFTDCYFDQLKDMSESVGGPAKPVDPADRRRLSDLVCAVALENAGVVPDLDAPSASPKIKELKALIDKVGPAAGADILKDAVKSCGAPPKPASGAP